MADGAASHDSSKNGSDQIAERRVGAGAFEMRYWARLR
jgi:hypothetical protein